MVRHTTWGRGWRRQKAELEDLLGVLIVQVSHTAITRFMQVAELESMFTGRVRFRKVDVAGELLARTEAAGSAS